MKFLEKLMDPTAFGDSMSNIPILSTGVGYRSLPLGGPRDETISIVYAIT
jgi:hypothetical protein